ncbi:type IX secretion system sortase PorU [Reichenbachiella carrageenanivorans]|uniref:Type IX secretion system sortase PorU n=1 Tax=Reichenbachiella carrageenanivorans TaxID=2979869 RepID=A0ABY6D3B7_9BACT|nr:type IX secretion system sortase PorU [Reichenbachiella carrageenanivorans]UXX80394.1 type IX secretion system sortase PorU [Reichenbachiella carrageenanivorans]
MKGKLHIVWGLCLIWLASWDAQSQASSSVLADGQWYKIAILHDGIYKIDRNLLEEMGIAVDQIDPRKLALYGNAMNGMLPQANSESRPNDLSENAIFVVGQSDGQFNNEDYLLFYGKSSDHLSYNPSTEAFAYERNVYSDTAFYFLTVKASDGKRMPTITAPAGTASTQSSYAYIQPHELEKNTIINSGRHWFGERFTSATKTHKVTFTSNGIVGSADIDIFTSVLSRSIGTSSFDLNLNGISLGSIDMDPISSGTYVTQADVKTDTFSINPSGINTANGLTLNYTFNESGFNDGYIDYVHMVYERTLSLSLGALLWHKRTGEAAYKITGAESSAQIWDITNPTDIIKIQAQSSGSNLTFGTSTDMNSFLAFNDAQATAPILIGAIDNQNLHDLPAADGIIITHRNFLAAAQHLAEYRTQHDGLLVEVVTVDQIYNEFSSGAQDVSALRDFIKFQYDKYNQLKQVLLFGDCSFDYKDRSINSTNFVPVYESRNSLHKLWSYSSDDYFGFMEDNEGEWIETQAGDHTMEIGVGRIPIQTSEDGEAVINKIIRYQTNRLGYGKWRNKISFIADDGDNNIHQQDANKMATYVDTTRQELNVNKIYLDAYKQDQNKSPAASEAFVNAISDGNLIVNFTGHGNEGQLTHEGIFDEFMISDLSNNILMSLFITATCQFGNYDYPNRISGGEKMVLLPYGGSVALITATRPVYSNTNFQLNEAFYFSAMNKANGQYKRLGEMMRETKNSSLVGAGNRNYALLGDPMMRISFPEQTIALTAINGQSIDQLDTLRAFGKYTISGEVQVGDVLDTRFDGILNMIVFDKPAKFQTLGDESTKEIYDIRDVLLFQGKATITEGKFDVDFIVPKNINYSFGEGKISFYALNKLSTIDAHGAFSEVIVGGSEQVKNPDKTPPNLSIYLNDTTFQSGETVGPSPVLMVKLTDESGINISNAGFGNELMLYLNDEEPVVVNEYYEASLDTYQEGWITYPFDNLAAGRHELTLVASDIFNNETEETIEFFITKENGIHLTEVINYPNPIMPGVEQTTISFKHDRLGEDLFAYLTITDIQGQEILTQSYRFDNVSENMLKIVWNLNSSGTGRVRKGIYIYRLKVQSRVDGSAGEVFRRMVILN